MPKARTPLDLDRYQTLKAQGLSQRQIAATLGMAESTLRENLKALQKPQTSEGGPLVDKGVPQGPPDVDQGTPQRIPEVYQGLPRGLPQVSLSLPAASLSTQDLDDLQHLLAWWRARVGVDVQSVRKVTILMLCKINHLR